VQRKITNVLSQSKSNPDLNRSREEVKQVQMSPAAGRSGSPGEATNVMVFEDLETIFVYKPDSSND